MSGKRRLAGESDPLVTLDVRERPDLARKYGIAVVPTVLVVAADGTVLERLAPWPLPGREVASVCSAVLCGCVELESDGPRRRASGGAVKGEEWTEPPAGDLRRWPPDRLLLGHRPRRSIADQLGTQEPGSAAGQQSARRSTGRNGSGLIRSPRAAAIACAAASACWAAMPPCLRGKLVTSPAP